MSIFKVFENTFVDGILTFKEGIDFESKNVQLFKRSYHDKKYNIELELSQLNSLFGDRVLFTEDKKGNSYIYVLEENEILLIKYNEIIVFKMKFYIEDFKDFESKINYFTVFKNL